MRMIKHVRKPFVDPLKGISKDRVRLSNESNAKREANRKFPRVKKSAWMQEYDLSTATYESD